jgi:hypothetical protein
MQRLQFNLLVKPSAEGSASLQFRLHMSSAIILDFDLDLIDFNL